jgi:aryl-alcohol dehydrogenase-like predicted oxidoreductase
MKHVSLGGLDVSRIGLGTMTMAGFYTTGAGLDDAESIRAIHRALDLGVTHIDTAEIYYADGASWAVAAQSQQSAGRR